MLLGAMDSPFAGQLLAAQLGPLLDYDERRGTQLVLTAWTFHENGGATQETASSLDVQVALRLWRMKTAGVSSGGS